MDVACDGAAVVVVTIDGEHHGAGYFEVLEAVERNKPRQNRKIL